jgi:hypothetical protein
MAQNQVNAVETKKKVFVPPMRYPLTKLGCFETIMNIVELTHGLKDLPKDVARAIEKDVCSREFSYYGFIPAPPSVDMVKQIIGIDGYYLKVTTKNTGVSFIWHDRQKNEFQFWGDYQNCIRAMNEIRYRICKYVDGAKVLDNMTVMKTLIDKLAISAPKPVIAESVIAESVIAEPVIFDNDINPNSAVCYEAHCTVDATGRLQVFAEKHYPTLLGKV